MQKVQITHISTATALKKKLESFIDSGYKIVSFVLMNSTLLGSTLVVVYEETTNVE